MEKKPEPEPERARTELTFRFRCRQADIAAFKRLAEAEGFAGNVSAWLLWHLRRIARESGEKL